jgi:rod shape-determining protein MreD
VSRLVRHAALVVGCVVVQVTVLPHLRLLGVVPDLGLVLAAAVAFHEGPEPAALAGFAAGLGFDLFVETPVGMAALSYALTGYLVGVVQASLLRAPRWISPVLGAAAGLVGGGLFVLAAALSGTDEVLGPDTTRVVAVGALYDALLAPIVFAAVRRALTRRRDRIPSWSLR